MWSHCCPDHKLRMVILPRGFLEVIREIQKNFAQRPIHDLFESFRIVIGYFTDD
jgi:hypothetical protein